MNALFLYGMLCRCFRGTYRFSDIMKAGSPEGLASIKDMQDRLQFDDPINIQFTSVRHLHTFRRCNFYMTFYIKPATYIRFNEYIIKDRSVFSVCLF